MGRSASTNNEFTSATGDGNSADRRGRSRHKYMIPAEALLIDEKTERAVSHVALHVRDVSRTGVRVISACPWEAQSLMALSWVCPNEQRLLKFCRIRNHKLDSSNWYTIGLSFEVAPKRLAAHSWLMLVDEVMRSTAKNSVAA